MFRKRKPPPAPQGVHLTLDDGQTVLCDVLYDGKDKYGLHRWYVVPEQEISPCRITSIGARMIPPLTSLVYTLED